MHQKYVLITQLVKQVKQNGAIFVYFVFIIAKLRFCSFSYLMKKKNVYIVNLGKTRVNCKKRVGRTEIS